MSQLARVRRSPLVMGIVIVGIAGSILAAMVVRSRSEARADEWLSERAEIVRSAVQGTVRDLSNSLDAAGAYMEVTESVTQEGFAEFVGRLDPRLSLIGVAYVPIVPAAEREAFEAEMRTIYPGYEIRELNLLGEPMPALRPRDTYFPVQYFVPGRFLASAVPAEDGSPFDLSLGVDAGSNPEWKASLVESITTDMPVVSDFIRVAFDEIIIGQAFVIAVPVHGDDDHHTHTGVVAAPMIDVILPTELDVSITADVTWEIASAASEFPATAGASWVGEVELPGVSWQLRVLPSDSGAAAVAGVPAWLVFAIGLGITTLAAGIAQLVRQRARSRARLAELQRLSEDKDQFLAAVSHEIRTPLTAVAGLAHELRDRPEDFGAEEARTLLSMVAEQSDEVAAIVEDLLVAARSDIGRVAVHAAAIDVWHEADLALETSGVKAAFGGARPATAWADPQRVRQIVRNLLTNAGRYGGGEIEIRFETTERWVTVLVADDGSPIPDEEQRRIFDPYTSAHEDGTKVGSIGLGLFISRKLATLMGGDLSYHHDGDWSVFALRVPRADAVGDGPLGHFETDLAS